MDKSYYIPETQLPPRTLSARTKAAIDFIKPLLQGLKDGFAIKLTEANAAAMELDLAIIRTAVSILRKDDIVCKRFRTKAEYVDGGMSIGVLYIYKDKNEKNKTKVRVPA